MSVHGMLFYLIKGTSFVKPIPVVELFKARVCGRSLTGIAGWHSAGGMYECCVLSGRDLCDGPIPRPEKSYRLLCALARVGLLWQKKKTRICHY